MCMGSCGWRAPQQPRLRPSPHSCFRAHLRLGAGGRASLGQVARGTTARSQRPGGLAFRRREAETMFRCTTPASLLGVIWRRANASACGRCGGSTPHASAPSEPCQTPLCGFPCFLWLCRRMGSRGRRNIGSVSCGSPPRLRASPFLAQILGCARREVLGALAGHPACGLLWGGLEPSDFGPLLVAERLSVAHRGRRPWRRCWRTRLLWQLLRIAENEAALLAKILERVPCVLWR